MAEQKNIVVCIKQVPDAAEVKVNPQTGTLIREGVPSMINPFDLHALEAALQLRETLGEGKVIALSMGPPQAEQALRDAIALGAQEAVLLTHKAFAGSDTLATSYALAKAIQRLSAKIVLCGKQAIDGDTSQVGPEVAELLNIPHVAYVRKIRQVSWERIVVERLMEEGYDVVASSLPVLLTVVKELNEPRPPSLRGKMAAKRASIPHWGPQDIEASEEKLGLRGSPTQVKKVFAPQARGERRMLEGSPEQQVEALIQALKEMKCL